MPGGEEEKEDVPRQSEGGRENEMWTKMPVEAKGHQDEKKRASIGGSAGGADRRKRRSPSKAISDWDSSQS